ncbi:MAG: alanine--tRNA ligase [Pirellulales bacterium]
MKTDELREKYLSFFQGKGHTRCASDVLVPTWDPSVLFTPAGMNQFKDHFLGKVKLDFTRATTCQKCLRTGDIENVGRTAYHHTFFEMLGNFSFGDYFKRDAIHWAWEFLTDKKWLAIDPTRLSVSVYKDDNEAADIWANDIGLSSAQIERLDEDENFWPASAPSQGPDGVCGPCSEIFYHDNQGMSVEIWNLVFTQFNRVGDPPDNLRQLPSKNIDTGMGLERTAATLQGVETNFHIDILRPIVEAAAETCGTKYIFNSEDGRRLRRITDHIRACTMAVHENVYPGSQKEKYVVRRLVRRAVLDGHQLGRREPFLFAIVPAVVEAMKAAYPELAETVQRVSDVIKGEEENFFSTIDAGLARIERIFADMKTANRNMVDGAEAADLYQTFGVPPEVFEIMAAENNLAFDWDGFDQAMEQHGVTSGKVKHSVMGSHGPIDAIKKVMHEVQFVGYDTTETTACLKFIVAQDQLCDHFNEVGHDAVVRVLLDRSPFYGESGGQVGDTGEIVGEDFRFRVTDTQRDGGLILHFGHLVEGELRAGADVKAKVDADRRRAIRRAHSATHLLHHALQKHLGTHAQQQGSKVDDDWLRFDFANPAAVTDEQLAAIAKDVDQKISSASSVKAEILPLAEARATGAMMLFGEKYPDPVRLVSMGDFSKELCGGTHVDKTSDVDGFEIISEESVAAGTRRIIALTGQRARQHVAETERLMDDLASQLDVQVAQVPAAVTALAQYVRDLKKRTGGGSGDAAPLPPPLDLSKVASDDRPAKILAQRTTAALKVAPSDLPGRVAALQKDQQIVVAQLASADSSQAVSLESLLETAIEFGDTRLIVREVPGANAGQMRSLIDQLRRKSSPVAVLLASTVGNDKVLLVAGISSELEQQGLHAGNWVRNVATVVGGSGGGKADFAQAGGKLVDKLPEALEKARDEFKNSLAGAP